MTQNQIPKPKADNIKLLCNQQFEQEVLEPGRVGPKMTQVRVGLVMSRCYDCAIRVGFTQSGHVMIV